jgi:hypothetical protein
VRSWKNHEMTSVGGGNKTFMGRKGEDQIEALLGLHIHKYIPRYIFDCSFE